MRTASTDASSALATVPDPIRPSLSPSAEPREAFRTYVPLLTEWRRLPYLDPGLPLALLPAPWHAAEAADLFARLDAVLREPAHQHARATLRS